MSDELAPIAIFAYRRSEHLRRTLMSLMNCEGFSRSPLYVYCDGAKGEGDAALVRETREMAKSLLPSRAVIMEAGRNRGLASSILEGVTEVCKRHGRVIVMEDDIEVASKFLLFMNNALNHYATVDRVMQVSGYVQPIAERVRGDAVFLPYISSWAWGTWWRCWGPFHDSSSAELMSSARRVLEDRDLRRSFDLQGAIAFSKTLEDRVQDRADVWAILWYLHVFLNKGLTLYPVKPLARNIGLDGSGTNIRRAAASFIGADEAFSDVRHWELPAPNLNLEALKAAQIYFRGRYSIPGRLKSKVVRSLKRVWAMTSGLKRR